MNVLLATSEVVPYASSGGLGDVSVALPRALKPRRVGVARIMPCYRSVLEQTRPDDTGLRLSIPLGRMPIEAAVYRVEEDGIETFFIRHDAFFDREGLYGDADGDYVDNFERFTFFQMAVAAFLDQQERQYDIVHCNDWQTGLIPLYLRHGIDGGGRDGQERTVFTIHNLAYQGLFPSRTFPLTNLPPSTMDVDRLEFYGQLSFLKGGITSADMVTTVSPTYAAEIQTEAMGCGLHDMLQALGDRLVGILNGADYEVWDPAVDAYLDVNYDVKNLEGKAACKRKLQEVMGLTVDAQVPILGMVARLADQKGLDLLSDIMDVLMEESVQFALLGAGQAVYEERCRNWAKRWPGRFSARIGFDHQLAHQIEAGADIFLMPSRFEPCGLNQMYSLRYGTVPVVHATGGLEDTIVDLDEDPRKGNGIKFRKYGPPALLDAVQRALRHYNGKSWDKFVRRAMRQDFSWKRAAGEYKKVYQRLARTEQAE